MKTVFRIAVLGLVLAISILSLMPSSAPASVTYTDKIQHALAYGALAGLTAFGWPRWPLIKVFLYTTVFGVAVEVAQALLTTSRSFSGLDMIANAVGAVIVLFIIGIGRNR